MPFFADAFDGGQGEAVRVPQAQGTLVKLPVAADSALMPSLLTLSDVFCTGHHGVTTERVQPGHRWRIEESFQAAKDLTGLDQHQVRRWTSWHRWTTLAMLTHAFLAVATADDATAALPLMD